MEPFGSFGNFGNADLGRSEEWQLARRDAGLWWRGLTGFGSSAISVMPKKSVSLLTYYIYRYIYLLSTKYIQDR